MIKTETKSGVFYSKKHQNCKRKMEIIKECGVCGKAFVASQMSFKYCCRGCERVAFRRREAEKKKREKENAESLLNAERNNSLRDKAFLSPEDVSVLFDVSLPTVYRYFQTGLIKAVKIRNKTFVRYSDIERVFDDATPYRKRRYQRKEEQEYYTLREIMEKYNIGRKAIWGRCDRLGIPKIYEGRNTFFSKWKSHATLTLLAKQDCPLWLQYD